MNCYSGNQIEISLRLLETRTESLDFELVAH